MHSRPGRAAIVVSGVAVSSVLVMVLMAAYRSVTLGIVDYLGQPDIDLWVTPRGTDNLMRSSGLIPAAVATGVAALPGVKKVGPLMRAFVTAHRLPAGAGNARGCNLLGIGYLAPDGLGGPPKLAEGRRPRGPGEIVIDRAAAWRAGLHLGEQVAVNGRPLRLVGLSRRTNLIATQFAFLDLRPMARASGYGAHLSFLALHLDPGADVDAVARRIATDFPEVSVYRPAPFLANNVEEVVAGFRPIQLLVSAVGLIAAAVLVMLLVQAMVDDRRRDVAVLLALGARLGVPAGGILAHAARLVVLGCAVGVALTYVLQVALDRFVPLVELKATLGDALLLVALFLGVALASSLWPLLRLRQIDPVEAFRP